MALETSDGLLNGVTFSPITFMSVLTYAMPSPANPTSRTPRHPHEIKCRDKPKSLEAGLRPGPDGTHLGGPWAGEISSPDEIVGPGNPDADGKDERE
ncbi:hypothetical protein QJS10_CPA02g00998 [Acorus calamus]|uniref:Uncharacterized protein n=1 Tax=Acorus calamus TaxID=4465 RepID=A0AAV9FA10_ACOCL|nr:hypothetical protein QJS10_CPA02g00998 [Acorus calamus]